VERKLEKESEMTVKKSQSCQEGSVRNSLECSDGMQTQLLHNSTIIFTYELKRFMVCRTLPAL
jgi:hypothetical protein